MTFVIFDQWQRQTSVRSAVSLVFINARCKFFITHLVFSRRKGVSICSGCNWKHLTIYLTRIILFLQFCRAPPADIITLLKLRLVYGPPLCITIIVILFIAGLILGGQGFYRIWKPRYKIIPPTEQPMPIIRRKSQERRRSSVHENIAFKDDDELAKEAVSLLAINEEEGDFVELIISDENEFEVWRWWVYF